MGSNGGRFPGLESLDSLEKGTGCTSKLQGKKPKPQKQTWNGAVKEQAEGAGNLGGYQGTLVEGSWYGAGTQYAWNSARNDFCFPPQCTHGTVNWRQDINSHFHYLFNNNHSTTISRTFSIISTPPKVTLQGASHSRRHGSPGSGVPVTDPGQWPVQPAVSYSQRRAEQKQKNAGGSKALLSTLPVIWFEFLVEAKI